MPINPQLNYEKRFAEVRSRKMAYIEVGQGDPIVFVHGNPTSSHLWRNIIPHVEGLGRCIAVDLIGFGDSDKLPGSDPYRYGFYEHREFFSEFLEAVGASRNVTLVVHDWGSAIGFDWASRHRDGVKAIAYMEAIIRPLGKDTLQLSDEIDIDALLTWIQFREPTGEELILEKNLFVERFLPGMVLRDLTDEDMEGYRRPFLQSGEDRRTMLTLARQVPIEGQPEDLFQTVEGYSRWMCTNQLPKLLIIADPGLIITGPQLAFARSWHNQHETTVRGVHFLQEDSPDEIGQALADWYRQLQ